MKGWARHPKPTVLSVCGSYSNCYLSAGVTLQPGDWSCDHPYFHLSCVLNRQEAFIKIDTEHILAEAVQQEKGYCFAIGTRPPFCLPTSITWLTATIWCHPEIRKCKWYVIFKNSKNSSAQRKSTIHTSTVPCMLNLTELQPVDRQRLWIQPPEASLPAPSKVWVWRILSCNAEQQAQEL